MPAVDEFPDVRESLSDPCDNAFSITPHDTNELVTITKALYVGTGGHVVLVTKGGTTVTFKIVSSGQVLPVRAKIVKSTSTTAADIVGLA